MDNLKALEVMGLHFVAANSAMYLADLVNHHVIAGSHFNYKHDKTYSTEIQ